MKTELIKLSVILKVITRFFKVTKVSFKKSLKGEEKLSTVFWGWVVVGNLAWVLSVKFLYDIIAWPIVNIYRLFFERQFCEYFVNYGVTIKTTCFVISLALVLMMYIIYPLISQVMLFQSARDKNAGVFFVVLVKTFSIMVTVGLFLMFGYINLIILTLGTSSTHFSF